ncbi:MAG TPA: N-acetylmuramic acid 6-phosphate etherase [Candidatus Sphingobacterium stercoripullorum]|uniref:N-acetylmuramic acid 6-phosphate etherase n=1 Tax=Candidatus Sphingobacterium stercoripullorum TaxID=2838759 RepID=A0A9D1W9X9_9SPHI|nr:N-acetylmuramic acid 6-phosphate etherase [Candidatus Sphingobacterium stercoripullorum]HLR49381.1 N-acetylmuramic acid 6-phosphate etherase [Candidatus Sphingobacterium stercoripullorum]
MVNSTEKESNYQDLDKMSVLEILENINKEDQTVAQSVNRAIGQIEKFVSATVEKMKQGGRLFYLGAGTSGRLGILDASECPPTFGVPHDWILGLIAGGDSAIRNAVEFAEDDLDQAWKDLQEYQINQNDVVMGIAASGTTPYVIGALKKAREEGMITGCIVCNFESPIAELAEFPIEVVTGPEFVTGSTRMKAGTAQKLVLNMVSTSIMIQLGRVKGNKMIDMQLSNHKLVKRGVRIIMDEIQVDQEIAANLLDKYGNVRTAIESYKKAH